MYANGRAKGPGRWYRASLSVGRPKGVKPLPFSHQVLPMRMTPTSRNPGCRTDLSVFGKSVDMSEWDTNWFLSGKSLKRKPAAWRIDVRGRTFFSDDATHALAWVRAANHYRHRLDAVLTQA